MTTLEIAGRPGRPAAAESLMRWAAKQGLQPEEIAQYGAAGIPELIQAGEQRAKLAARARGTGRCDDGRAVRRLRSLLIRRRWDPHYNL